MSTNTNALDPNQASKDLRSFDFSGRDLSRFDFSHADLRGANFNGCTLHAADFYEADIRGTVFTGASFYDPALRTEASDAHCSVVTSCDECFFTEGGACPCSGFNHFFDPTSNWMVWDRPESIFMGTYGGEHGWLDDDAIEMAVEYVLGCQLSEFENESWLHDRLDSPEMDALTDSIFWSRYAHNATAFLVHAIHDETTVWPDQEHLDDFPYWNQPNRVDWSPIGVFVDE